MRGRGAKTIAVVLLAAAFFLTTEGLVPQQTWLGTGIAEAQQVKRSRKKRRSLLERLFGGSQRSTRAKRKSRFRPYKKRRKRRSSPAKTIIAKVEKLDDAKTVLVVGDFFAGGLAKGLTRTFAQSPGVRIVRKSKGSSGFVRLDYYDWASEVGPAIEKQKPAVVIAMLGTNDRQLMRLGGNKLQRRSEEWDAAYKVRVENFIRAVQSSKTPLIWVGLPPVRFKKMNQDFLFFNEIYRTNVEKTGGQFIDVWDGFTDADGNFVTSGPNVAGQIVRLRSQDGINVSKSGQDKLAFYVEKAVKKYLGAYAAPGLAGAAPGLAGLRPSFDTNVEPVTPSYDPARTGRTIVINLNDPALDGGDVLAGGPEDVAKAVAARATSGQDEDSGRNFVAGRADDFSWPRKSPNAPLKPKKEPAVASGRI